MTHVVANRLKESTVTAGTGDITLAGAVTGFQAFSSRCSVNDTVHYCIQEIDGSGNPSGNWEVGLGTYVAANVLQRTVVEASSNSDSLVNFSSNTKAVFSIVSAKEFLDKMDGLLFMSAASSSGNTTHMAEHTGDTVETILACVKIPAGRLGTQGRLIAEPTWSWPSGSTTAKTLKAYLSPSPSSIATASNIWSRSRTTAAGMEAPRLALITRGRTTEIVSQFGSQQAYTINSTDLFDDYSYTTGINFSSDMYLIVTGQLATSTDKIRLSSLVVEVKNLNI